MTWIARQDAANLRPLDPDMVSDVAAVAALINADPGYVDRVEGRPPGQGDAIELLRDGPAGIGPKDKVVLGAFEGDRLVAVVDLIRGWPSRGTALIGLLQVHAEEHGHGLGRAVHQATLDWVMATWPETCVMRAVVAEPNATHADPFWRAMGYLPHGAPVPYSGERVQTTAQVWSRTLAVARRPGRPGHTGQPHHQPRRARGDGSDHQQQMTDVRQPWKTAGLMQGPPGVQGGEQHGGNPPRQHRAVPPRPGGRHETGPGWRDG